MSKAPPTPALPTARLPPILLITQYRQGGGREYTSEGSEGFSFPCGHTFCLQLAQ